MMAKFEKFKKLENSEAGGCGKMLMSSLYKFLLRIPSYLVNIIFNNI